MPSPEAIAASISALCALLTLYLYRSQGCGFVWTKSPSVGVMALPDGRLQVLVQIPLFNLGSGNLRFLELRAKRVHLKTGSVEPFVTDMAEAHFPPGAEIVTYRTPVYQDLPAPPDGTKSQFVVVDPKKIEPVDAEAYQEAINSKVRSVGQVLFVIKCKYRNGSWFGLRTQTTVIAMCLEGTDLNYLSRARLLELKALIE